ncbi:hypothetical protein ACIBAI_03475 [Streptomyces sp. NPDC051041]|uniref:hypothetical protein n=1 Tax=Streptomyces sp. NPDC051041 TaxID=3365640 RepID=UPI0037B708CA
MGGEPGTLRQTDRLGGARVDVLTLEQVTGEQLVATSAGAGTHHGGRNQATATVRRAPVGDDLRYESDGAEPGRPEARLSTVEQEDPRESRGPAAPCRAAAGNEVRPAGPRPAAPEHPADLHTVHRETARKPRGSRTEPDPRAGAPVRNRRLRSSAADCVKKTGRPVSALPHS